MLSSFLYTRKLSKTTSPNKLLDYDCVTLYIQNDEPIYIESAYAH